MIIRDLVSNEACPHLNLPLWQRALSSTVKNKNTFARSIHPTLNHIEHFQRNSRHFSLSLRFACNNRRCGWSNDRPTSERVILGYSHPAVELLAHQVASDLALFAPLHLIGVRIAQGQTQRRTSVAVDVLENMRVAFAHLI